jgi:hypothetical protein
MGKLLLVLARGTASRSARNIKPNAMAMLLHACPPVANLANGNPAPKLDS